VLLIVVTPSTLTAMEGATTNVVLEASNNIMCMTYIIPHLDVLD
jgi:hypothetical protein